MSRARFADHFLRIMGQTLFEYLTYRRIGVAQLLLKRGEPLKTAAPTVRYSSVGALTRTFTQIFGKPPMSWLAAQTSKDSGKVVYHSATAQSETDCEHPGTERDCSLIFRADPVSASTRTAPRLWAVPRSFATSRTHRP